jgi:hypothetical protein
MLIGFSFAFPSHQPDMIPSITNPEPEEQIVQGCIGDCASCHSVTKEEAKEILKKKIDIKEIVDIITKRGYFEIKYKDSKERSKKINLFFSKDKACKEIILLDQ